MAHTYVWHELANTLTQRDYKTPQAVVVVENEVLHGSEILQVNAMHDQQIILRGGEKMNIVRRLTPLECERLQGFPDGWTDIGEWTDSKGKKRQTSDTNCYKALGNSIALPYWKVLARRVAAQYDRDITMGSLFDGIGGFPLAFEHCGAKAVWASEIEDFCIAVTKRRFDEKKEGEEDEQRRSDRNPLRDEV